MAVKRIDYVPYKWIGTDSTTDVKPIDDVPVDSIFEEYDTGDIYRFNGTTWVPIKGFTICSGLTTGGSVTTLIDTSKVWLTNDLKGLLLKIKIGTKYYYAHVLSNTSNTITFTSTLAEAVTSNCVYEIIFSAAASKIMGLRSTDGVQGEAISFTPDPNEIPVMRVILAAMFGYDAINDVNKMIDLFHSYIHDGKVFVASYKVTSLNAAATTYIQFTTGAKEIHLKSPIVLAELGKVDVSLLEAPSMTTGNSTITANNRNRNSTNTATVTLFNNPSYTSGGASLDIDFAGANQNPFNGDLELILKPSTNYLLKLTNTNASAQAIFTKFIWTEM